MFEWISLFLRATKYLCCNKKVVESMAIGALQQCVLFGGNLLLRKSSTNKSKLTLNIYIEPKYSAFCINNNVSMHRFISTYQFKLVQEQRKNLIRRTSWLIQIKKNSNLYAA